MIRQYALKFGLWQMFLRCEGEKEELPLLFFKEKSACFFSMTHVDSITKNIQLLSNLLYSYWLPTSEYPTSSRSINHVYTLYTSLETTVNVIFLPTYSPSPLIVFSVYLICSRSGALRFFPRSLSTCGILHGCVESSRVF